MLNHLEAKKKNFNKDIYDLHNPHLLQAIFTIAFFSGARISELTFSNMKKFTHCKALKLKHNIWFGLEQFSILKSTTKADQFGLRSDLHFGRTNHHIACPVTIMKNYFNARKAAMEALDDDAYLFACRQSNGIIAAMTDYQFRAALKKVMSELGEKSTIGWNFRVGMATTAFKQGVSETQIKMLGRWSSDAYLRYLRNDADVGSSLSEKLVHGL